MSFLECLKSAGKILHGNNYLWSIMKKSSVYRMQKVSVFSDSVLCRWKDAPEPTIKYCLGRQVDVVQEFIANTEVWSQLMVSQWNSSGIFPRIHHIAALQ